MKLSVLSAAVAAAVLTLASPPSPASAAAAVPQIAGGDISLHRVSSGDRKNFRRDHRRGDRHHGRSRHRDRDGFRFGIYVGPRVYGYAGDCAWLRRRAIQTGSRYWWRRYRDCRGSHW